MNDKKPRIFAAFAVLLAAWAVINPAAAGQGIWTSSGPNGGSVNELVASPFIEDEFYALSSGSVFKSTDGGVTWSGNNAGINRQVVNMAHSQTAPNRLMVSGATRVFFTEDGAAIWQDRTPAIALPDNIFYTDLEVSASQPGVYYLIRTDGAILRTADSGLNWTQSPPIPQPLGFRIEAFAADPATPDRLLVSTVDFSPFDTSLWTADLTSPAAGPVWTEVPCPSGCPWESNALRDIEFDSLGRAWAVRFPGVYRSDDAGLTWTTVSNSVLGSRLAINPDDSTQVYVAAGSGLTYTNDDGANWIEVKEGFVGNDLLQVARATEIIFDPFDSANQLAGSQRNGVYRRISPPPSDLFEPSVEGVDAQFIRALATAPGNRVHAAASDVISASFVNYRSSNSGDSWSSANSGLEADSLRALTVDPNNPDVVYAGGIFVRKESALGGFDDANGGIYKSINGGLDWTTIDTGIPLLSGQLNPTGFIRDIEVDQFSADGSGDSQILYAAGEPGLVSDGMGGFIVEGGRIFKSVDAGANWMIRDTGLDASELDADGRPSYLAVVQIVQDSSDASGNTLYAATFIDSRSPTSPLTLENGVFKTTDGGANWLHASNGLPRIDDNPALSTRNVLSLAFDPSDPSGQTLYAATSDLFDFVFGSVYKTTDGGANWTFSGTGLENRDVRDLIVDPVSGDVYAAIADPFGNGDGGVFVSRDGGSSWASISTGFPTTAVAFKLALDTSGANVLIQAGTTKGVQTFEAVPDGDTDGAPNPVEDGAPNAGDGNDDGVPDQSQPNVASPIVNDAARGVSYITASLNGISGTCLLLQDSFGLDLLENIPAEPSFEPPLNGLHLRIPDCEQAEVTLIYHGANFSDPSYAMRGYGLAFPDEDQAIWHHLPATRNGQEWTFILSDGAAGDATPDDGIIVFQGAAKRLVEDFFSDSMEAE